MGSQDKEYVQLLAPGQKFQVTFRPDTEASKLSGEYKVVEIKSGRGRGGTLNVIAIDMQGNPMPDVPIEDMKHHVVVADRCFGTSAWPMVQKFSIEGRLIYDTEAEDKAELAKRESEKTIRKAMQDPLRVQQGQQVNTGGGSARATGIKTTKNPPIKLAAGFSSSAPQDNGPGINLSDKNAFLQQRTTMTNARVHATANQPKKVYDSLLPILENKGNKTLLLRFSAVPITSEVNGDYSVVSYRKDAQQPNKLILNLQSLDIPNKTIEFETDRTDIHIKRIDEITPTR
jgi:hypothetical protein